MNITIDHIFDLLGELPRNTPFAYVSGGDNKAKIIAVDRENLKVDIARVNADGSEKNASMTTEILNTLVSCIKENKPFKFDNVLNGSGNVRSTMEAIFAHTSEFYYCKIKNVKHLIWIPTQKKEIGVINEISISDVPLSDDDSIQSSETIREEFKFFLSCCVKSSRSEKNSLGTLTDNSVNSYLSMLDRRPDGSILLFDYAPSQWTHIQNIYNIVEPERAEAIFVSLLNDPSFVQRDKEHSTGWRPGALNLYILFLRARNYFSNRISCSKYSVPNGINLTENKSYITAIKTKPFLILGGFSGTGKSQKVKELAFMTCPNDKEMSMKLGNTENSPGNYCLVSVRPNWHDSSDLLGFYSTINDKYMVTDFVRFLVKARHYSEIPFFVCLDEMNLAPVEEYFAEFLSVIESRKKVGNRIMTDPLISKDWFNKQYNNYNIFEDLGLFKNDFGQYERQDIVDELKGMGLCIPQNIVVIGTVNMDDTTNSFSRKVIDRAMTFETVVDEFDNSYYDSEDLLKYGNATNGNYAWLLADEVNAKDMLVRDSALLKKEDKDEIVSFINEINACLANSPFQISYRILNETILYYRSKSIIEKKAPVLNEVFDDILMQKILPRIEGDYDKTYTPLNNLKGKAGERHWDKSLKKISFMLNRLNKDDRSGFTSFWN